MKNGIIVGNSRMKGKDLIICLLFLVIFISCKRDDSYYFNGDIIVIDKFHSEVTLEATDVVLEGAYEGQMMVYDSIMLFCSFNPVDYWMRAYNVKTGQEMVAFCPSGQGPDDYLYCTTYEQFVKEEGELKLWVNDYTKNSKLINITQTILSGNTVCDSVVPMKWIEHYRFPSPGMFFIENGNILAKHQCEPIFINEGYTLSNYKKYHKSLDEEIQDFIHYKETIGSEYIPGYSEMYFGSCDRIKPDLTKIAMPMQMVGQINIWNLKNNHLRGYRISGSTTLVDLEQNPEYYRYYYMSMSVCDQYILALYMNNSVNDGLDALLSSEVHVFDWEGTPLYKLHLKEKVHSIDWDGKNRILYAQDFNDNLYAYNVDFLK